MPHSPKNIAHGIKTDIRETEELHLLDDPFPYVADPAHHAGNRAKLPHKADDRILLRGNSRSNLRNRSCF